MADPIVVLVHGAWHAGWCFASLQGELDAIGIPSLAVDLPGHGCSVLPLGGLHDDARHLADILDGIDRDVVLVGHSYGGAVITEAAGTPRIVGLVYIAAFALDPGETVTGFLRSQPRETVALGAAVRPGDRCTTIDPGMAAMAFYGDAPAAVAAAAVQRLGPQSASSMNEPITHASRALVPSLYVQCDRDQAVHPAHQSVMAARCDRTVHLDSDHSPFLGRPGETAAIVAEFMGRVA